MQVLAQEYIIKDEFDWPGRGQISQSIQYQDCQGEADFPGIGTDIGPEDLQYPSPKLEDFHRDRSVRSWCISSATCIAFPDHVYCWPTSVAPARPIFVLCAGLR